MARRVSARRHAQAVFQIALERNELERWREDLDTLATVLLDAQLKAFLENPKIRLEKKIGLLQEQFTRLNPLAVNLATLLATKGRVGIAADIANEYRNLLNAHQGLETVEVVSAVPLGKRDQDRITKQLSEATGKEITLSANVLPDIIGGLVIRIGDQVIDGSTKTRLDELKKALVEQGA